MSDPQPFWVLALAGLAGRRAEPTPRRAALLTGVIPDVGRVEWSIPDPHGHVKTHMNGVSGFVRTGSDRPFRTNMELLLDLTSDRPIVGLHAGSTVYPEEMKR